jgi:hypothetical protein
MTPRRINRLSVLFLAVGWGLALALYLVLPPPEPDPLAQQFGSKRFRHELRVMGGGANVAFAEFEAWFADRWRGRNVAPTLAVLTVAVVLLFRFAAARPGLFRDEAAPRGAG